MSNSHTISATCVCGLVWMKLIATDRASTLLRHSPHFNHAQSTGRASEVRVWAHSSKSSRRRSGRRRSAKL
eukprot:scaffold233175_cov37-Tisochrysis_lutea.AAC.5